MACDILTGGSAHLSSIRPGHSFRRHINPRLVEELSGGVYFAEAGFGFERARLEVTKQRRKSLFSSAIRDLGFCSIAGEFEKWAGSGLGLHESGPFSSDERIRWPHHRQLSNNHFPTSGMESLSSFNATPFTTLQPLPRPKLQCFRPKLPLSPPPSSSSVPVLRALKSPRGFGPAANRTKKQKKKDRSPNEADDDDEEEEDEREDSDVAIPEVVTNRMMRRVGLSVGIPLSVGLLFFPFFYYLKVVAKVDVPTWIPFIVSFMFFGMALLGVSYGIVSASWDPLREGSLLGWNEARRNWPVFWDSLWGGGGGKKKL